MNRNPGLILAIALAIGLILSAGCTYTSGSGPAPAQLPVPGQYPAVSFSGTPVRHAAVNGISIGYREFGSGEPLLMLQGFGSTMNDWNETFIGILATKYHVYTYDPRGMGTSSDNKVRATIPQYADDAAGMMTALGYESMHVYGVSMGSSVAQQLAIDHPGRVRKLVLDSSTYSVRIPETQQLLGTLESIGTSPSYPAGIRREAEANLAWNGSFDSLSGIHKDVMLIVGTEDVVTPDPISVRMAGQINGSWLVRFRGIQHAGSNHSPVLYGENALWFLGMDESPLNT